MSSSPNPTGNATSPSPKEQGTVKWFSNKKGYGFIKRLTGEDVFVHYTAIEGNGYRKLEPGEAVEFELVRSSKGLQAAKVVRL